MISIHLACPRLQKTVDGLRRECTCIPVASQAEKDVAQILIQVDNKQVEPPKFNSDIQRLQWSDQVKQAKTKPNGMRWHPAIIR